MQRICIYVRTCVCMCPSMCICVCTDIYIYSIFSLRYSYGEPFKDKTVLVDIYHCRFVQKASSSNLTLTNFIKPISFSFVRPQRSSVSLSRCSLFCQRAKLPYQPLWLPATTQNVLLTLLKVSIQNILCNTHIETNFSV